MAYLLPVVHMLKQREQEEGYMRRAKRPKIVVLAPTKELTEQVRRLSEPTADMQQLVSSAEHRLQQVHAGHTALCVSQPEQQHA